MNLEQDRRLFLKTGGALFACPTLIQCGTTQGDDALAEVPAKPSAPNNQLSVGVMGCNSRGGAIIQSLLAMPEAKITHVCDVDSRTLDRVQDQIYVKQRQRPNVHNDIRKMLESSSLDAVFIAAPNHWHAPAAIMACDAGKHVYVEKPCSHNPAEGEWAIQAAERNKRVVQTGTQRRSWPGIMEGIQKLHDGEIGEVLYARCWYNNRRPAIGNGKPAAPPEYLDWDLWQGPAPRREYKDNVVPYKWHWHWHWGNGEIGNNGVHGIDLARWGMQLQYPTRVIASGGKVRHEDGQETPDTMLAAFDYSDGRSITWEGLSWSPQGAYDTRFGVSFHGTDGAMVMRSTGYTTFDSKGKQVLNVQGVADDRAHFQNFFDCIRSGSKPRADIQIGHESALHCHLGNIAYRTSSSLKIDPVTGRVLDHPAAMKQWTRSYAPDWDPRGNRNDSQRGSS